MITQEFSNLDIPAGKEISYITNLEKGINSDLKLLKDKEIIEKAIYKNIKPVRSGAGALYGLGKVHKEANNGLPHFRLILSAIGAPTYKLGKFLIPFLTPLTQNEYTVTETFHFAEEVCKQDPNLYMASLDVDSLFTNIPLDEIIDICIDSLYQDDENSPKILKDGFRNLLTVATKVSFFMFNKKLYKQIDGVAMGSPLDPALANIFMCNFENKWLKDCPHNLRPVFYRWYVDNIFVLISSLDQVEKFKKYYVPNIQTSNFCLRKKMMVNVYISIFSVKKEDLSLIFIAKRPSVVFLLISTASYLKPTKLV